MGLLYFYILFRKTNGTYFTSTYNITLSFDNLLLLLCVQWRHLKNKATFTGKKNKTGPDPGFSIGGVDPFWGGVWPPTWAVFSENVCENERIGSCRGRAPARPLDPPM